MGNPLLLNWFRQPDRRPPRSQRPRLDLIPRVDNTNQAIFQVLRRMRTPLIVLIAIFTVSVVGLSLIPGVPADGRPTRLTLFDSFYFMSYTATTIGYGEIPTAFSYGQRLWVTLCIYLTVIGWAYAIGTLLGLGQDHNFRRALAVSRFRRQVRGIREPFLIIAGYGPAGRTVGRALDALGRRFTVLDLDAQRVAELEVDDYYSDVPGLLADAADPATLGLAGLGRRNCRGVLALTGDEQANLAVLTTTSLLRPDLPVVCRASSLEVSQQMVALGAEAVIDPEGRFGEYLALSLLQPASYQLMTWLMTPPGELLPPRPPAPGSGRWAVHAEGRFAAEMASDLRAVGLDVTVTDPAVGLAAAVRGDTASLGTAGAVGLVAGSHVDTTNIALIRAARQANPKLYVAARLNERRAAPLLDAVGVDTLLVPDDLVAQEVLARAVSPMLWQFLTEVPAQDDAWAADLVSALRECVGRRTPEIWRLNLQAEAAPALVARLAAGNSVRVGQLYRDPQDQQDARECVPLLLVRASADEGHPTGEATAWPGDDVELGLGDAILFAGQPRAYRRMAAVAEDPVTCHYACTGQQIPATWVGRKLAGARAGRS